jgi:anti-anti-sigma regulatory factor
MLDLAIVARRLRRSGRLMHLRNAQPQVLRVIEIVGLKRLPGVAADEPPRVLA